MFVSVYKVAFFYGYFFFNVNFCIVTTKKSHMQMLQKIFWDFVLQKSPYFEKNQFFLPHLDITFMHHVSTKCDLEKHLLSYPTSSKIYSFLWWMITSPPTWQKKKKKKKTKKKKLGYYKSLFWYFPYS
jgi:hypothetical protein